MYIAETQPTSLFFRICKPLCIPIVPVTTHLIIFPLFLLLYLILHRALMSPRPFWLKDLARNFAFPVRSPLLALFVDQASIDVFNDLDEFSFCFFFGGEGA
jgi:hypothetical protein